MSMREREREREIIIIIIRVTSDYLSLNKNKICKNYLTGVIIFFF